MPNFDGTGPRGKGRRSGRGRGVCRWGSGGRGAGLSGRAGVRLSDLFSLVREALSIWGAYKALRGGMSRPSLSFDERDLLERENRQGLKKPIVQKNEGEIVDVETPSRLIEYFRAGDR